MTMKTKTDRPPSFERVHTLLEEVLAGSPHFLVELEVRGTAGSQAVNVFIDSDDVLDAGMLAKINREVSFLIDTEGAIVGGYRLNVSTPGLDRPLKYPRQYKKNVGRDLRVHYRKPDGDGYTEVLGTLETAAEDAIEVRAKGGDNRRISYTDILWAKVQLPW